MKQRLLYVSVIFIFIPVFAVRPMTSLFANELEASMFEIGAITACYSIAPLILAVFAGRYIDRYGEKIPILIGSIGIFLALCLPYLFPEVPILFLSQLLLGGSQLFAILAIQNGVAKSASNKNRDRAVGTFSLFSSMGMLLGPLIGGYSTEHFGFQHSFILLALAPIIPMLISLFISNSSGSTVKKNKQKSTNVKGLFQIPGLGRTVIVSMVILSALDIFYVYFPLYAQSIGLNFSQIGLILAAQAASNVLVRIFMPSLVERFGRVPTLWVFMMIGALSYCMIPFLQGFVVLFIVSFLLGAGLGVTQPLTIILSYNVSPPGQSGEVLGLRLAGNRLAQTIIPFLFANLSSLIGLGPIFFIKGILLAAGAISARGILDRENKGETLQGNVKIH